jgi:hypothetical protein
MTDTEEDLSNRIARILTVLVVCITLAMFAGAYHKGAIP